MPDRKLAEQLSALATLAKAPTARLERALVEHLHVPAGLAPATDLTAAVARLGHVLTAPIHR